ncbi:MAG: LptF/LptG family permease [Mariprofundaceae bacterium]|nr:LptF/LptG family permease [Mariprofundaceae bacterium]
MTVLFRWMFLSSLSRMFAVTMAIVALFMLAESIDKMRYIGDGLTLPLLAEYVLLKAPFMVSDFMPVVILIAVAIHLTDMSHHHEMAALRAAGIAMPIMLKPLLLAATCLALLTFAFGEWVEPTTNPRLSYIERVHISQKQAPVQGEQWLRDEQMFLHLSPLTHDYFALTILKVNANSQWLQRIDAAKAHYEAGAWHLEHAYISLPANQQTALHTREQSNMRIVTSLNPATVATPDPRNMQWLELYDFAQDLADAGLESQSYVYQFNRKMAVPIACLIMVLLAYSLCENMGSRIAANSKGLMVAIVLGIAFYIFGMLLGMMVDHERLPAMYAAWLPSIFFLGLSGYLLLKKEGY